jgi:hypothetical protein
MIFSNMSSEIMCLFFFVSSDRIFERRKKVVWREIFFVYFSIFVIMYQKSNVETLVHISDRRGNSVL